MTRTTPARPVPTTDEASLLDLLRSAAIGVFPGAVLESLIDRLEVGR